MKQQHKLYFPLFVDISQKKVVIIGGGKDRAEKNRDSPRLRRTHIRHCPGSHRSDQRVEYTG